MVFASLHQKWTKNEVLPLPFPDSAPDDDDDNDYDDYDDDDHYDDDGDQSQGTV